ncbi:peptidoglycan DD-metalloendopeptidase family protein [Vibrio sp. Makdt]|uniref:peptidoglycan DD-metalloendopeptidase family protein n=1 Tax=Vibrio sp. Makdt TaxID=2998828 RepID=UPI0022CD397E|nr:peptidoglycan DD-metalloendopeptidase family protein [Vibrio sp. Makdt]MDA0153455.1 peptidoglycan DD-metalloendopeptidase family protein [Vibrio sp. Makdt]
MKYLRIILIVVAISAFSLAALLSFHPEPEKEISIKVTPYQELHTDGEEQAHPQANSNSLIKIHYFVKVGDTLSNIFESWNLPYETVNKVMEADLESLKLDTIKPGDHLELLLDSDSKQLVELVFHESLVEQAAFTRNDDGSFTYKFHEIPGEWKEKLYAGSVHGSFSTSAYKAGLTTAQIANITRTLKDKVNFARELRAGDSFNVLVNEQYTDNHLTGKTEVQGISIQLRNREVAAFLAPDGLFYDREGNSLEQAFDRYPVDRKFRRITSSFNPKRRHPVTGRISPHNGTDFATPVGAPVYSTGDGRVVALRDHPYAGKYLVIEHNSVYTTRYLHLSRFLVKKGQQIKRGQKIALSGATGRITGPHLHFEVLVRGRAVDAMKANLPMASSIMPKDRKEFLARIAYFDAMISKPAQRAS